MTELATMFVMDGVRDGKIEVAKNLLKEGMSVSFITRTAELEESEVLELIEELGLETEYSRA